ncbi:hypothetical protein ACFOLA_09100 [Salinicoccus hispanicus]|uniref:Uncharacterized protein n=1 Tax=Salinicoccus hispanicus TaxID=157225 RepID=A0A6N8TY73_9STAP|nr:hypothetical protein [Salinicoccus hispanicus]MXQ49947.1 hypothetical protein [Salinicoccus hispanicus]
MSDSNLHNLELDSHYTAQELEGFISTTDAMILSSNEDELFADYEREYKVTHQFKGYFEQTSEDGKKYYTEKRSYVVEKV